MKKPILRGELYYADLEPVIGSEQGGERPVVVIQNNKGNRHSKTVIIAPLTTSPIKPPLPTHVEIHAEGLRSTSIVLLEQIRTIDKKRITHYIGIISKDDMVLVDEAILASLGIQAELLSN
ncbi:MAG: type II toxin-antitoxin system PemK/MazF family toxin [Clostridia bacterium]|nr:type II toxin-antitoxin system PemK/MazF family toxin [Clostridia bacterium]